MKKQNLLWLLTVAMMMGGCGKRTHKNINEYKNINDTLFVVGVLNQPAAYGETACKYLSCVNKTGVNYEIVNKLTPMGTDRDPIASYIERGDTIVVQNGKIVKNLTMENLKSRYINGR